ncbi:helix-turn-helix domain-containing protein [Salinifilum aidingensis]
MAGRPPDAVVLSEDERAALLSWTRSRKCSQALALRARIVLACEQQGTSKAVSEQLGVSPDAVRRWRSRYLAEGLEGLAERRRPGRPPRFDETLVSEVLVRLLEPAPSGRRWSTRSMATAVGASQATVSRIWRTYRLGAKQAHPSAGGGADRAPLPNRIRDVVGLFLAPPTRVLAVAADEDAAPSPEGGAAESTASMQRRTGEAREVLAVANAFAQVGSDAEAGGSQRFTSLRAFLERLQRSVPASMAVHLLVDGFTAADQDALADWLQAHPRLHQHVVPPEGSWLGEVDALLARNPLPSDEHVLGFSASLAGLREDIRAWCSSSTPPARPFTWTKSPRSLWSGDQDYHGLIYDSDQLNAVQTSDSARDGREAAEPSAASGSSPPRIADRVAALVREELAGGRFKPGERVKEAPLAARLGVSRGPVREALRVLAEEGMLELLPNRGAAAPHVSAENIIDLYALRASVGSLLMRRIAMRPRSELRPVRTALAQVQSVARDEDRAQIGEADLRFQDVVARTTRLPQAGMIFERLTMRLRMFNSALQLDWAEVVDLIAREDAGIYEAVHNADGAEAARRWRVKIERSVRYMVAQLPQDHFDPNLWVTLAGKPPLRRDDPRGVH